MGINFLFPSATGRGIFRKAYKLYQGCQMQNEPAVGAQPAAVQPAVAAPKIAGRVAVWTAGLVALAAFLDASLGVVKNAQLLVCNSVGIVLPACPPKPEVIPKPSDTATNIPPPVRNPNNKYSVFVYYTGVRASEAKDVGDGLSAAGFQITRVQTALDETGLKLPAGSTFVLPSTSDKGDDIRFKVGEIVHENLPNAKKAAVTLGGAYAIKSGDVQVQLY